MTEKRFGWKDEHGNICQYIIAKTKEDLCEMSGFGVVDTDRPVKGRLAVGVAYTNYGWVEYME